MTCDPKSSCGLYADISTLHSPDPDPVEPAAAQNPFLYGYGYSYTWMHFFNSIPIQLSLASHHLLGSSLGLAKAKRTTPSSPIPSHPMSRKHFSAPLPFMCLVGGGGGAVPIIGDGSHNRERGLGGDWDKCLNGTVAWGGEPLGHSFG
ncbi:hypothetical protein L208DRAFT_1376831 [Tricholoma matsutake]|nr:hypothetical protein L208DRAFT_1376831 [Tricholoma matsutake 945]